MNESYSSRGWDVERDSPAANEGGDVLAAANDSPQGSFGLSLRLNGRPNNDLKPPLTLFLSVRWSFLHVHLFSRLSWTNSPPTDTINGVPD